MKKSLIITSACAFLAILPSCRKSDKSASTDQMTQKVTVALPEVKDIVLSKTYPGSLLATSAVDVVCKVDGQIVSKHFENGTNVRKGQVLFTIDPAPYRDKVNQAQAALTTAISSRDYASDHYEAVKKALESDAVSKIEVIQAQSTYEQAVASVKNAQAALSEANRMLGYCTVTAPISGRVAHTVYDLGTYISGEASPVKLTTVYDNTSMVAQFAIEDERYLDLLNSREYKDSLDFKHVPVTFSESLPHTYTGDVTYLAPALNLSTGTMTLNCNIENPYDELRQGMYVKIALPYGFRRNAVIVKDASVGSDQLGTYLYTVNDSNRVVRTAVTPGELYQDTLRVIESGLAPGTRYVTKAMLKVRAGMEVDPVTVK